LKMKCGHDGCNEYLTSENRKSHEKHCTFKPVACVNSEQCGILFAKDLDAHIAQCPFRQSECPKRCGQVLPINLIQQHLLRDCASVEVTCEHGCDVKLKRGELEEHVSKECPYAKVVCEFAEYGCSTSPLRLQYEDHLDEYAKQHLTLLSKAFKKQKEDFTTVKKELDEIKAPKQQQCCFQDVAVPLCATLVSCAKICKERCSKFKCEKLKEHLQGIRIFHLVALFLLWSFFNIFPGCIKFFMLVGYIGFLAAKKRMGCNRYRQQCEVGSGDARCGIRNGEKQQCAKRFHFLIIAALLLSIFNPLGLFVRTVGGCAGRHCYH